MIDSLVLLIHIISFIALPLQRTLVRCTSIEGHSQIEFAGQGDCCSYIDNESPIQFNKIEAALCRCNHCIDLPLELPNFKGNQRELAQGQYFKIPSTLLPSHKINILYSRLSFDFGVTYVHQHFLFRNIKKIRFLI